MKKVSSIIAAGVFAAAFGLGGCAANAPQGDSYKVENVGGVPRLVFNGKPVRARMLYVSPTYFMLGSFDGRSVIPSKAWINTFIEIPKLDKPLKDGEFRFDVAGGKFEAYIAAVEISERDSGKKVYSLNAAGDDRAKIVSDASKSKLAFDKASDGTPILEVKATGGVNLALKGLNLDAGKIYRIDIKIRGNKSFGFRGYVAKDGKFIEPQLRSMVGEQTKVAKDAGVDIVTFPVQMADLMPEDGKDYNFRNLKRALDEIVAANPNAKILLRIRFYPPDWWRAKYPDDVMTTSEGNKCEFPCVSSKRYRDECVKVLSMFIDYCEQNYNKNIVGYHPGGGNSCEWFYGNSWSTQHYGYNKTAVDAWKKWVGKKYKTNEALQKAWNDPAARLDKVEVPTKGERDAALYLINPKTQEKLADYNYFLQDEMVDMVELLGRTIRKKVPNKLSALFYGYACEFGGLHKGPANTGHYALWKIANSPNFDLLSGPVSYADRELGEPSYSMGAVETITRCGKIWFDEDDIRTHRTPPTQQRVGSIGSELTNLRDTESVMQRDLARQAIRNNGCWWMDLSGTGWYDDPELWKLMTAADKFERDMIENPVAYDPEIAVIIDEQSVYYGGASNTAKSTTVILRTMRREIGRIAAPYGMYLFDDFAKGKKMSPKLAIFPTQYAMTARERNALREKTKDIGAIFVWAPAYIDLEKNKFSRGAVEAATGFEVERIKDDISARVMPTDEGRAIGLNDIFGFKDKAKPLFSPKLKDGDKVLAVYENDMPAIVLRGKHLFCGVAHVPRELYLHMAKISGVHVYTDTPASVFASGAYISVTALRETDLSKPLRLDIPSDKDVFDALTGEKLGKAPTLELKMKVGDNRILRLGKGNSEFAK